MLEIFVHQFASSIPKYISGESRCYISVWLSHEYCFSVWFIQSASLVGILDFTAKPSLSFIHTSVLLWVIKFLQFFTRFSFTSIWSVSLDLFLSLSRGWLVALCECFCGLSLFLSLVHNMPSSHTCYLSTRKEQKLLLLQRWAREREEKFRREIL